MTSSYCNKKYYAKNITPEDVSDEQNGNKASNHQERQMFLSELSSQRTRRIARELPRPTGATQSAGSRTRVCGAGGAAREAANASQLAAAALAAELLASRLAKVTIRLKDRFKPRHLAPRPTPGPPGAAPPV